MILIAQGRTKSKDDEFGGHRKPMPQNRRLRSRPEGRGFTATSGTKIHLRHNLEEVADELSESDFKDFHRLVQDMALRAYPNPDRIGCPGQAALEEVASLPLSSRHELFQTHINRCSECLRELLEIRHRNYEHRQRLRLKRCELPASVRDLG